MIEDARIEHRNHFEALVPRIYELGGRFAISRSRCGNALNLTGFRTENG